MKPKLLYKRGEEEREIVCAPLLTIGRVPPNEIVIPHPKISRHHAMIRQLGQNEYYLIDAGSTNGTFLNGKRIVTPTLLKDRDAIVLEDSTLTFHAAGPAAPAWEPGCDDEEVQLTVTMTSLGIQTEEITLLVCDIRNYTPISERLPPTELAALMSRWFKLATKAIEECSGTVDKFIGDAIMVRWSSSTPTQAHLAVTSALRAARKLSDISEQINHTARHLPCPFKIGVGINSGSAVLGSIGGSGYREYTAIGDAVNMAFRFETESKALGKDVVVGPDSCKHIPSRLWEHGCREVTVKGKSEPVAVWAITFAEIEGVLAALDGAR